MNQTEQELLSELKNDYEHLNNYGKLRIELLEKGRDYILKEIPPEDIRTEEDLYAYPIPEYEELYDLMITENMKQFFKIRDIVFDLEDSMLGEYIDTRIIF